MNHMKLVYPFIRNDKRSNKLLSLHTRFCQPLTFIDNHSRYDYNKLLSIYICVWINNNSCLEKN